MALINTLLIIFFLILTGSFILLIVNIVRKKPIMPVLILGLIALIVFLITLFAP